MPTADEVIRLKLEADTAAAASVTASLNDVEQRAAALAAKMQAAGVATAAETAELARLNAQVAGLRLEQATAGMNTLAGGSRNMGRAVLDGSRALEDLQYGVAGVLNNIPGLISSLGGPAGLAGAVSLVAVGAKILYDHWDDLAGAFGQGHVKTQAEQMEDLGKQTAKTADELKRLIDYEEHQAGAKQVLSAKTEEQQKSQKVVDKAIAEVQDKTGLAKKLAADQEKQLGRGIPRRSRSNSITLRD